VCVQNFLYFYDQDLIQIYVPYIFIYVLLQFSYLFAALLLTLRRESKSVTIRISNMIIMSKRSCENANYPYKKGKTNLSSDDLVSAL